MKRQGSLRVRFLTGGVLWVLLGLSTAGLSVATLFRLEVTEQFHDELRVHLVEFAGLVEFDAAGRPFLGRRLSDPRFIPRNSGFYWQLSQDGVPLIRSASLGDGVMSPGDTTGHRPQFSPGVGPTGKLIEYGMHLAGPTGPPFELTIGADRRLLYAMYSRFERVLVLALAGFAAVMIVAGGALLVYGLRPLERLRRAVAAIREGRVARMPEDFPLEIRPLVADLNAVLDANAEMVTRARVGAGNLAHGLRTPLAILLDEARVLEAAGAHEAARTLTQQCQRMQRQIDYHIARARAVGPGRTPGVATEIAGAVEPILGAMRRLHAGRDIDFVVDPDARADARVACDPVDLGEMISNLLDNAGKWARARVVIGWGPVAGDLMEIRVEDDGPGLPPAQRDQAFALGERLDDAVPGSGLGLAIVRDLVRLHGGDVELADGAAGGLAAILRLPELQRTTSDSPVVKRVFGQAL